MISIIIPSYNHNDLLPRAVDSAIKQSGEREIIVVDDGSDEPVKNIWGADVKIIRHSRNKGLSPALNTGIAYSKGSSYVILAADDQLHPAFATATIPHTDKADIVSCDMMVGGKSVRGRPGDLEILKKANCHSYCALISKNLWRQTGGYNAHMNPSWEDWEFFLHCAKLGATWHHVNVPLHIYNRSNTGRDAQAQGQDILLRGKMEGFHQDVFGKGRGVVSVVIPCYDHEQYLEEAIQSCLRQKYPHVNIVVVDDGSPGDVVEIVKGINSEKVQLVRQKNKHLSGARNTGIRHALNVHNSEYVIPLDADDTLHPEFIEATMGALRNHNTYVYTDVQFIGDAYHTYELPDYDCIKLAQKHLHACAILMPSAMWRKLVNLRGYGYDETMKNGYEDWEFALAAVQAKYCGLRVPKFYFGYRHHKDGSMRTEAAKVNADLVKQVWRRQPWVRRKETAVMGCRTCGGNKYVKRVVIQGQGGVSMAAVNIPSLGQLDAREPIAVTFTGAGGTTYTKLGQGGTVYKYSGNPEGTFPPSFVAYARDAHLFVGPFIVERVTAEPKEEEVVAQAAPTPEPVPVPAMETAMAQSTEERLKAKLDKVEVVSYEVDDLTDIKGVGTASAEKLGEAGYSYIEDVADANAEELATVLSISKAKAEKIKEAADSILE